MEASIYCKNCGAQLSDSAKFCNQCGVLSGNGDAFCPICGVEVPIGSAYCQNCGESLNGNEEVVLKKTDGASVSPTQARENYESAKATQTNDFFADVEVPTSQPKNQTNAKSKYSMKWYKFLLFALVISALTNFGTGLSYVAGTGSTYEDFEIVYKLAPALETLETIYGAVCILMAGYCFVVMLALGGYKKKAPKMLIRLYLINMIVILVYSVATIIIVGSLDGTTMYESSYYYYTIDTDAIITSCITQIMTQCIVNGIMISANKTYFKTREELFVK